MKKIRISSIIVLAVFLLLLLTACNENGESAYEIAVRNGYTGSEMEWLLSLYGTDGKDGKNGVGVESVKIDEKGDLIVLLTNGKTVNAGYIGAATPDNSKEPPKLNVTELTLPEGNSFILLSDRHGTVFESSDPEVVQVSREGLVLALKEGTATITATARDGQKTVCNVNVSLYTYKALEEGNAKIVRYNGHETDVAVPETIMGLTVTEIGRSAFADTYITAVTLPDSVVAIDDKAFADCSELAEVNLGNGVKTIGNSAFEKCVAIEKIIIPAQVTSIGESAFADCEKLAEVTIDVTTRCKDNSFENTPWKNGINIYNYDASKVEAGMYGIYPSEFKGGGNAERDVLNGSAYIRTESTVYNKAYLTETVLSEIMGLNISANEIPTGEDQPLVLIVHSHTSEAYAPDGASFFEPNKTSPSSNDAAKNVVAVGNVLVAELEKLGIPTLQIATTHDEKYSESYDRSAETINACLGKYPSIKYVVDLHRDAYDDDEALLTYRPVSEVNGQAVAQVMCVVSTGVDDSVTDMPWKENLALAQKFSQNMNGTFAPNICRPTILRDTRTYNQEHKDVRSLLLEVGMTGNTLDEAKLAAKLIAPALANVIKGE